MSDIEVKKSWRTKQIHKPANKTWTAADLFALAVDASRAVDELGVPADQVFVRNHLASDLGGDGKRVVAFEVYSHEQR